MNANSRAILIAVLVVLFVTLSIFGVGLSRGLNLLGPSGGSILPALLAGVTFAFVATALFGFVAWIVLNGMWGTERWRGEERPWRKSRPIVLSVPVFVLVIVLILAPGLLIPIVAAMALIVPLAFFGYAIFGLATGRLPKPRAGASSNSPTE